MANKSTIKIARQLLDRFFRDAEGRTNRQIDVYFSLEDMGLSRDRAEAGLEYLVSRGLVNTFGPDIAYLTEKGAQVMIEDLDISTLPKQFRDFVQAQPKAPAPAPAPEPPEPAAPTDVGSPRPDKPILTHIDPDGREYVLELGVSCTIGRAAGNDIRVNDQRASKKHVEVYYHNNAYAIRDLGSANGTLLNGEYVDESVLHHDDELVVGRTMLLYQTPEIVPAPRQEPNAEAAPEPPEPIAPIAATERPAERPAEQAPDANESQIRVVRGTPDPMPPPSSRHAPAQDHDLFGGDVEPEPDDLFTIPPQGPTPPQREAPKAPSEDLFSREAPVAPSTQMPAADPPATSAEDLFTPEPPLHEEKGTEVARAYSPNPTPQEDLFSADAQETAVLDSPGSGITPAPQTEQPAAEQPHPMVELEPIAPVAPLTPEPKAAPTPQVAPMVSVPPVELVAPFEPLDLQADSRGADLVQPMDPMLSLEPSEPMDEGAQTEAVHAISPDDLIPVTDPIEVVEDQATETIDTEPPQSPAPAMDTAAVAETLTMEDPPHELQAQIRSQDPVVEVTPPSKDPIADLSLDAPGAGASQPATPQAEESANATDDILAPLDPAPQLSDAALDLLVGQPQTELQPPENAVSQSAAQVDLQSAPPQETLTMDGSPLEGLEEATALSTPADDVPEPILDESSWGLVEPEALQDVPNLSDESDISAWDEPTPADPAMGPPAHSQVPPEHEVLLANQPVVQQTPAPEISAKPAGPIGEETDTLMLSRSELFPEEAPKIQPSVPEDLPRWGEASAPPMGSHPEFAAFQAPSKNDPQPEDADADTDAEDSGLPDDTGESMPVATLSLANLRLPDEALAVIEAERAQEAALQKADNPFHQTLELLHEHASSADLSDQEELLKAIEVLRKHPFIRVALKRIAGAG